MNINTIIEEGVICDSCGHLVRNVLVMEIIIVKDNNNLAEMEMKRLMELFGKDTKICWFCFYDKLGIKPISLRKTK